MGNGGRLGRARRVLRYPNERIPHREKFCL